MTTALPLPAPPSAVYPLVMGAALLVSWALGRGYQRELHLAPAERRAIASSAIFCGFLGAKLPFLLAGADTLTARVALFETGKTLVGGLIGGYFGVEFAKWMLGIRVKTGDSFVVPVAIGIAIGRLGCFAGRCCYGAPTSVAWGVDFGDGVTRHPAQLYEFTFHLLAGGVLAILARRGLFPRQLFKLYILAYLAFRFATEFLRPEQVMLLGLTGYQLSCLAFTPVFVALYLRDRHVGPVRESSIAPVSGVHA